MGRFNSGGTASVHGLLIGAEMVRDPAGLPALVAHELIHFQQPPSRDKTLLAQSFREGAGDFPGEMISGVPNRSEHMVYGLAHEKELWAEFEERMRGTEYTGWLYGDPGDYSWGGGGQFGIEEWVRAVEGVLYLHLSWDRAPPTIYSHLGVRIPARQIHPSP